MRQLLTAAAQAKLLLDRASRQLNTASPAAVDDISRVMDAAMYLPVGDSGYRNGGPVLRPRFEETMSDNLSFLMDTGGPGATPADRIETSTRAMSRLVGNHFGPQALNWYRGRSEPVTGNGSHAVNWGAWFGTGLDHNGVAEASASYEWGPGLMDSLPSTLYKIARVASESLPGMRPSFSTIRCGRTGGSQQITFEVDQALPLANLQPLMQNLGLGHQHAGLMSACALILGARFTLPPNTATVTLRPTRSGVELRLDVMLDALPDTPSQLLSLLRLQLGERPRSLRALQRWVAAMTPDGYPGPGQFSVLSVWVRADVPARVALYLRPAILEAPGESARADAARPQASVAAAAGYDDDWSGWGRHEGGAYD
ncbi:MAG: hypothetical protein ACJ754_00405 [Pyrinomonadaceae bacterium]